MHDPVTPPAGEQLDRAIDIVMPRIRITELLWDVGRHTSFLDTFTDLRSGRTNANPATVLASVLAGVTNWIGAHGASLQKCQPRPTILGFKLVSAPRNLQRCTSANY